jgi:LCP family protein required for cell wall assembly
MSDRPTPPDQDPDDLWSQLQALPPLERDADPPAPAAVPVPAAPPRAAPTVLPTAPAPTVGAWAPAHTPDQTAPSRPPVSVTVQPGVPPAHVPPGGLPPEALPQPPGPPRRRRRRWPLVLTGMALALLLLVVGAFAYGQWQYGKIDRVALGDVLASGGEGTNWLIVGSDSRQEIDPSRPDAGWLLGEPVDGQRSDAMVLLHIEGDETSLLSLPRDLWVDIPGHGEQRLNAAFALGGARSLVETVQQSLGVPVHHYAEIDITGFGDVVDAIGGITVDFPYPAFDPGSGLQVDEAGAVHLDGYQALAYVRSRHYTEIVDGSERVDGTGDIGRTVRQQVFLSTLFDEVGGTRNPITLHRAIGAIADDVTLDDRAGLGEVMSMARRLGGLDPTLLALPVEGFTAPGGFSALQLGPGADQVLDQVR